MRLFVAIALPDAVASGLLALEGGIPGARWSAREQLHLTLRFIGEVDGRAAAAIDDALATIRSPRFGLELKGVGEFGGKNPRALWAGLRDEAPVVHLQRKVESAIQRAGLAPEERKFSAHVTLARLRGSPRERIITFLSSHALYASDPFEVNCFILYSSLTTPNGSLYRAERSYRLE
ncbi:MAG TPA: RNA 2',3'-cyclic phosphodiesterase [Rhizomicrobium sp.]|jgi:2'-5' RNA ligase|nr:RNA 2',3'-cyclic phosphodiesterase [Rhizomicrobium sp.]